MRKIIREEQLSLTELNKRLGELRSKLVDEGYSLCAGENAVVQTDDDAQRLREKFATWQRTIERIMGQVEDYMWDESEFRISIVTTRRARKVLKAVLWSSIATMGPIGWAWALAQYLGVVG